MKNILLTAALILTTTLGWAQSYCNLLGATTVFSESFNGSNYCGWTVGGQSAMGGVRLCTQPALVTGTGASVIVAPSGTPWCNNALNLQSSSTATYFNTFPTIASGSTFDLFFELRFVSMPANFTTIVNMDTTTTSGVNHVKIFVASATTIQIQGSTTSSAVTTATATDYLVHVHEQPGAAASYIQLNGGAQTTYTANANATDMINLQSGAGNLDFGNLQITSATLAGTFPPSAVISFRGTNAATVTTGTIVSDTFGGNADAGWAGLGAGFTYTNTIAPTWLAPVSLNGQTYTNNTGISMKFDCSGTATGTYTWGTISTVADIQGIINIHLLATDTQDYDVMGIEVINGSPADLLIMHIKGNGTTLRWQLEYNNNGSSTVANANIPFLPDTNYWYNLDYRSGGQGTLNIFSFPAGQLIGSIGAPANTPAQLPGKIIFGHSGAQSCPGGNYFLYGGVIINFSGIDWSPRGPLSFSAATVTQ